MAQFKYSAGLCALGGDWDDDMIAVSVHLQESLEFLYSLDEMHYDG